MYAGISKNRYNIGFSVKNTRTTKTTSYKSRNSIRRKHTLVSIYIHTKKIWCNDESFRTKAQSIFHR